MNDDRLENALAWGRRRLVDWLLTRPHHTPTTRAAHMQTHEYQYVSCLCGKKLKNASRFGRKKSPGHPLSYDIPHSPPAHQKEA